MGRKSIFDLIKINNTIEKDAERIVTLFIDECIAEFGRQSYSLYDFVDRYCFHDWPYRMRCLNVEDYLSTLGIDDIGVFTPKSTEEFVLLIEIVYNFWHLAQDYIQKPDVPITFLQHAETASKLKELMDDCLSELNLKAFYNETTKQCFVVEDSPAVTAAAEISESETAVEIIKYNHRSLKGNIPQKQLVLKYLGDVLEGEEKEVKQYNATLYDTITSGLNNLNIRHNNINPQNPKTYKRMIANMPKDELEDCYDELYQLILFAILLVDNVDRQRRMKELIKRVNDKESSQTEEDGTAKK